jgi:phage-related tail fiber protein
MAYKVIGLVKKAPTPPPLPEKLAAAHNIAMTGDVIYQQSFDGSSDVSGLATLSKTGVTAGEYPVVTVDEKGRITFGRALTLKDLPPLPLPEKLANARNIAMTGDVVYQQVFDGSADVTGAATLSKTGVTAGEYPVVTVDEKGRVVLGRALDTKDLPKALLDRIGYLEKMVIMLTSRS